MHTFLLFLALPLLTAAQGASGAGDVRFSVIEQGANSGVKDQGYAVIRTQAALDVFLKKRNEIGSKAYQGTNWRTTQFVVIYGGQAPTGGYGVAVKKITTASTTGTTIEARVTRPAPGTLTTQALTTPYTVIRTPLTHGKVALKWVTE